jgi:methylated-DNA-[protein]-cysteine S-methyltransferase
MIEQHYLVNDLGLFKVETMGDRICRLEYQDCIKTVPLTKPRPQIINKLDEELLQYLDGERKEWSISCFLDSGTPFQREVWRIVKSIPYGQVMTYAQIGQRMNSRAYQAIGGACGKNPCLLLVPCHRVIAQKGIGGFSAPLELKKKLLSLEGLRLS